MTTEFLSGNMKGIKPFGRQRRRWNDSVKMDLRETEETGFVLGSRPLSPSWRTIQEIIFNLNFSACIELWSRIENLFGIGNLEAVAWRYMVRQQET